MIIKIFFSFCTIIILSLTLSAQVTEKKNWCASKCNAAGDELNNTKMIMKCLSNDSLMNVMQKMEKLSFPIRLAFVQSESSDMKEEKRLAEKAIKQLNEAYAPAGLEFLIDQLDLIVSDLSIEDLSVNHYAPYLTFSKQHDLNHQISIYIFNHDQDFCNISPTSISCGRTGGFSFILSDVTNNLVLSRFDLSDQKVVAHEVGHFFGLYHTFEESQFGKDNFEEGTCHARGDAICDTPPDPGSVFEVYVNYSNCEMVGLSHESGQYYSPLINNYMSYYKPCYLKEYSFTQGQIEVIKMAALSPLRKKFSQ